MQKMHINEIRGNLPIIDYNFINNCTIILNKNEKRRIY